MIRFDPHARRRWTMAVWGCVLLCAASGVLAAGNEERVGVPGPIRFGDTEFALQWTSNPSPELYKQEYVPAGQRVERYESMLLVDVRPLGGDVAQAADAMIDQIKARKASDPVANFDVIVNEAGDEVLLDFVLSARDASGVIVEWNAYRYVPGPGGQGTTMVGISRRAYGEAVRDFLVGLKTRRLQDIDELAALQPFDIRLTER